MNKIMVFCVSCLLLAGCKAITDEQPVDLYQNAATAPKERILAHAKSGTVGAMKISGTSLPVAGKGLIAYIDQHQQEVEKLKGEGVQVVRFRDYVKLIIPSIRLFDSGTNASLASGAHEVLDEIVEFIRPIAKIAILVSVYTDTPVQYDDASGAFLSKAEARLVADYLWSHNADSRVVAAAGTDDPRPSISQKGVERNRVEIILRDVS